MGGIITSALDSPSDKHHKIDPSPLSKLLADPVSNGIDSSLDIAPNRRKISPNVQTHPPQTIIPPPPLRDDCFFFEIRELLLAALFFCMSC
jgi:hypothetical protein